MGKKLANFRVAFTQLNSRHPMRVQFGLWFAFSLLLTFVVYGRSLPYSFVYDDVWRIIKNPQVHSLQNPLRFFLDASTQSAHDPLNKHTFRPLLIFSFACEYSLWGSNPVGYRLLNFFVQGVNGALLALLGILLFDLSPLAILVGLVFFTVHPAQVETIVWIVERSNLVALTSLLAGLLLWMKHRESGRPAWRYAVYAVLAIGLGFRENAICLLPALLALDFVLDKNFTGIKKRFSGYFMLGLIAAAYLVLRLAIVGQLEQKDNWGGSLLLNFASVMKTWLMTCRYIFTPGPMSVNFPPEMGFSFTEMPVMIGLISFLMIVSLTIFLALRKKREAFIPLAFFIFWFPTSGLVPLATLFAARFLYPLLAPVAWFMAWASETLFFADKRPRFLKPLGGFLLLIYTGMLGVKTAGYLPVWVNEYYLWKHAVTVHPTDSFAWLLLGVCQDQNGDREAQPEKQRYWWDEAEKSFREALNRPVKTDFAGEAFMRLARVNLKQGKTELAKEHARRCLTLRPDLASYFKGL